MPATKRSKPYINTLENTVTFSGADISVIAYKGNRTPAEKFNLDALKKEFSSLDQERKNIRNDFYKQRNGLRDAAIQASADEIADYRSKTEDEMLLDDNDWSSFQVEQKYQNNLSADLEQLNADYKDEIYPITEKLTKVRQQIKDIEEAPAFFTLGSAHTISYSSFREKFAVRGLGVSSAKTYTRGPRTIAGTMVFNVFQEHEFLKLTKTILRDPNTSHPQAIMLDQIHPFNILLIFANEYGAYSVLHLFNIDLSSEGQEMSVDNIATHNTMNFYATDMLPMTSVGNSFYSYNDMIVSAITQAELSKREKERGVSLKRQFAAGELIKNVFEQKDEIQKMLADSRGLF